MKVILGQFNLKFDFNTLLENAPEVQRYVFDSLLKHQLTRENTFALIRLCGNEMYKVEKSKEET